MSLFVHKCFGECLNCIHTSVLLFNFTFKRYHNKNRKFNLTNIATNIKWLNKHTQASKVIITKLCFQLTTKLSYDGDHIELEIKV